MALFPRVGNLFKRRNPRLVPKYSEEDVDNISRQIQEQIAQHTQLQFEQMRERLFKREQEITELKAEPHTSEWVYYHPIKNGDTIRDANDNMFIALTKEYLDELKASKSAEAGTPPVQRKPAPRKGKRVQGRRTQKNGKGRRGKLA